MKRLVVVMLLLSVFVAAPALAQEGTTGVGGAPADEQYGSPPEANTQSIVDGTDQASEDASGGSDKGGASGPAVRGVESYAGALAPQGPQAAQAQSHPAASGESTRTVSPRAASAQTASPQAARAKIEEDYGYDELPDTGGLGPVIPLAAAFLIAGAIVVRRS